MFRFSGMCEDNKVSAVLRNLAAVGGVYEVSAVPLVDAKATKGGKVTAATSHGQTGAAGLIMQALHQRGGQPKGKISTQAAKAALKAGGMSPLGVNVALSRLLKTKAITRVSPGMYKAKGKSK